MCQNGSRRLPYLFSHSLSALHILVRAARRRVRLPMKGLDDDDIWEDKINPFVAKSMRWCCTAAVDPQACEQIIRSTGSAQFTPGTKSVLPGSTMFHAEVARRHFDTFAMKYLGGSVHKCCRCHATSSTRHCLERIPSCLRFVACSPPTTHSPTRSFTPNYCRGGHILVVAQSVTLDLRQNRIKSGIMFPRSSEQNVVLLNSNTPINTPAYLSILWECPGRHQEEGVLASPVSRNEIILEGGE